MIFVAKFHFSSMKVKHRTMKIKIHKTIQLKPYFWCFFLNNFPHSMNKMMFKSRISFFNFVLFLNSQHQEMKSNGDGWLIINRSTIQEKIGWSRSWSWSIDWSINMIMFIKWIMSLLIVWFSVLALLEETNISLVMISFSLIMMTIWLEFSFRWNFLQNCEMKVFYSVDWNFFIDKLNTIDYDDRWLRCCRCNCWIIWIISWYNPRKYYSG